MFASMKSHDNSLTSALEVHGGSKTGEERSTIFFYDSAKSVPKKDLVGKKSGSSKLNPTTRPVKLMRQLVRKYSAQGDVVLDLLSGLGSVSEAALVENRHTIAVESDAAQHAFIHARLVKTFVALKSKDRVAICNMDNYKATDGSVGFTRVRPTAWTTDKPAVPKILESADAEPLDLTGTGLEDDTRPDEQQGDAALEPQAVGDSESLSLMTGSSMLG